MQTVQAPAPHAQEVRPDAPSPASKRHDGFRLLLAYLIPVTAAVAATQTWFTSGRFIAAGDVSPFLRDAAAAEIGWLWTHQTTGAGSASSEIARAFEVGLVWATTLAGGSDLLAQRVLYAVVLGFAAFGVAYFAAALTRRPAVIACAGMLGSFTPLVLISNFNTVLLAPLGLLGVLAGMLLRGGRGGWWSAIWFAVATTGLSYVALNPPALAVVIVSTFGVACAATLLAGPGGTRRALSLLLRSLPLIVIFNLWWTVPVALALFGPSGAAVAAETDVTQWAWTHAHNSVGNVAALNAHWTWRFPEYVPFAPSLDHPGWVWMRYALPVTALFTPLVATRGRRRSAIVLALVAILLILVGKGLHPPFAEANEWLYAHLPGFWLLREPLNKVGPVLVLVYVALLVSLVESVWQRSSGGRLIRFLPRAVVVGSLCAALAYPWPLYTGAVVPDERPPLPGARVAVPDGWREAADAVNASAANGKSLVLPLNPYYQMTTNWGYHGVDTIAQQLIRRPVLQQLPGGYFAEAGGFDGLMDGVERALIDGDVAAVPRLLQSLGASHVLIRQDLVPGQSGRAVADQRRLLEIAHRTPALEFVGDFDVVSVFRSANSPGPVAAYQEAAVVGGIHADAHTERVIQRMPAQTVVTTDDAHVDDAPRATGLLLETGFAATDFAISRTDGYDVTRDSDGTLWDVDRTEDTATFRELVDVAVNGETVDDGRTMTLPARHSELLVAMPPTMAPGDPTAVSVIGDRSPVRLPRGGQVAALEAAETSALIPEGPVGDCNAHDERDISQTQLSGRVEGNRVRLSALAHSACLTAAVPEVSPGNLYDVTFEARTREGEDARVCVWDPAANRCAGQATISSPTWTRTSIVVAASEATDALEVFLYADGPDDGRRTTTEYRRLTATRYRVADADTIEVSDPTPISVALRKGDHTLVVHQEVGESVLPPLSAVSDCQRSDDRSPQEVGLAAAAIDGGVQLRARDHSACVSAELPAGELADRYLLEFEHRTLSGVNARVCLWQSGPDRCTVMPDLESGPEWSSFQFSVRPLPGAHAMSVYLYADGNGSGETITEYRDIRLSPALTTYAAVTPAQPVVDTTPAVRGVMRHPGSYAARVRAVTGPFVVTLAESYDPGWALKQLPDDWSARHIKVDGYANGWLINPDEPVARPIDLLIEHQPTIWARRALYVSTAGACLATLALLVLGPVQLRRHLRRTGTSEQVPA